MSAEIKKQKEQHEKHGDHPPNPTDAARFGLCAAKFFFDEIVVIKFLVRQVQVVGVSLFRPAGLFVGAAFGTGLGVARHFRAAIGANLGRHGKF